MMSSTSNHQKAHSGGAGRAGAKVGELCASCIPDFSGLAGGRLTNPTVLG